MVPDGLRHAIRLQDLPRANPALDRVVARIKEVPEDFEVEEIPAYPPAGTGDHLFVRVQKRDMAGRDLILLMAEAAGVPPTEVGAAGMKDRRAVTRQWLSIPASGEANLLHATLPDGVRILETARNDHKLRLGHLRGNRFRIVLRGVPADRLEALRQTAAIVSKDGFLNLFGEQRFGRDGRNLDTAFWLLGEGRRARLGGFQKRMAISALQAALFNRYLEVRHGRGLGHQVLAGDVMAKAETGGLFVAADVAVEQARLDQGETRITGPIYGHKMKSPDAEALALEAEVLQEAGLTLGAFKAFSHLGEGTRRALYVRPPDLTIDPHPDGVLLACTLPKGTYATVLIREFVQDIAIEELVDV